MQVRTIKIVVGFSAGFKIAFKISFLQANRLGTDFPLSRIPVQCSVDPFFCFGDQGLGPSPNILMKAKIGLVDGQLVELNFFMLQVDEGRREKKLGYFQFLVFASPLVFYLIPDIF